MPYNGSGTYTPPPGDFPAVTQTVISSTKYNNVINDVAAALTNAVTRDGQSPLTADMPLGGKRLYGLGMGTASAPALSFTGAPGTGIYAPAAGEFGIAVGGFTAYTVDSNRRHTIAAPISGHALTVNGSINAIDGFFINGVPLSPSGPLGTLATQNANAVNIIGGSITGVTITGSVITGITPLAIADGGTGAATAAGARANLGLGTLATQNANAASITGGSISGITPLAVADGGTGASTAAGARANLGLGTAATQNVDTSGPNVPLLNTANTWSAAQTFSGAVNANGGLFLDGNQLAVASTAEARDGLDNTKIITPLRLRDGLNATGSAPVYACRAWVNFNGVTGAIRAAGNVSSVTRHGTGMYTINFTTAMQDADYSVAGMARAPGVNSTMHGYYLGNYTPTTSSYRLEIQGTNDAYYDGDFVTVAVFR